MEQGPDLLTPAEVAERLRIDVETVHHWARKGVLPYVPLPGGPLRPRKRFRREAIEAIERGEGPAMPTVTAGEKAP